MKMRKNFVSDLLETNSDDDDTLDGDLSVPTVTIDGKVYSHITQAFYPKFIVKD
jgi:hypothetical protein